jgi:pimeloyl-ACP methyl ester carboxylesterase
MPLVITHGWPGSVIEMLGVVGPLTDPTAHGGSAEDAFDLVVPSVPGYGFSAEPAELGWGVGRVAGAWAELMRRLGYTRYVARGRGCRRCRHRRHGAPSTRRTARYPHELALGGAGGWLPIAGPL